MVGLGTFKLECLRPVWGPPSLFGWVGRAATGAQSKSWLQLTSVGKGRFGSNPSHKPFGSRFGQFDVFQPAIQIAFWKEPFGAEICYFGRPWAGYSTSLLESVRNGLFEPNRGREPFGAQIWHVGRLGAGYGISLLESLGNGRFGLHPGLEPFEPGSTGKATQEWARIPRQKFSARRNGGRIPRQKFLGLGSLPL